MTEINSATPSVGDPKQRYIFDQYSRYLHVANIVEGIIGKGKGSALDIGSGDECILGAMLPDQKFTFIDPLLAQKEGNEEKHTYLVGTIFDERLNGKSFSAVTSVDVLEHIPPEVRERFLTRVEELAEDLVVMAFPCQELPSDELDRKLNEQYKKIFGKDYPWLEEHFKYGMPSIKEVEAFFQSRGWHTTSFGQGYLPWLEEFLGFALPGLEEEVLHQSLLEFSKVFNEKAAVLDICSPSYRYLFVASKSDISVKLQGLFPVQEACAKLGDLTDELRAVFYDCILKEGRRQSDVISALHEEISRLAEKLNEIDALVEKPLLERIRRQEEQYAELMHTCTQLQTNLNQERFTVLKPILRQIYRLGVRCVTALPPGARDAVRNIKQRLLPQKVALQLPELNMPMGKEWLQKPVKKSAPLLCESSGSDIIVFPVIDWHFRTQRPQHLAQGLAGNGHRVFYLSVTFGSGDPSARLLEQIDERVFLYQLQFPGPHPTIYDGMPSERQQAYLMQAMDHLLDDVQCQQAVALIDHPFWLYVAQSIPGVTTVYDCMDDHGGFSNNGKQILDAEQLLLKKADAVLTASARLSEKIGQVRENIVIRNAAESHWFAEEPESLLWQKTRPVVGYFGAISDWFDIELVVEAAKQYPEFDFVLVGQVHECKTKKADRLTNVHFIGEVPYKDLKGYLYAFDVCLIPFKLTELIQCTNPVKLYEYLAAGKPVVATDMPEVRLVQDQVYLSTDTSAFVANIKKAMDEKDDVDLVEMRKSFALKNDWESRTAQLEAVVDELFPLVSVVVLTYNNLQFTESCLHSLEANTHYPNWELIIVDNASSDGTPDYLRDYAASRDHVKLILNEENLGFAAGNNVGLKQAAGEYQILLNNDTYVTPGWLNDLIHHFDDDSIGVVGPVTNNIGNEAKIDIRYSSMDEMIGAARSYTMKHIGERIFVDTAAFFCVAMRKSVIHEVGLLDEAFGRGFFEDDDYCIRVRNAGYKVAIADDVFVHHHLSASFNKLKDAEKQELFNKNKAIFEAKWGAWKPHVYRA